MEYFGWPKRGVLIVVLLRLRDCWAVAGGDGSQDYQQALGENAGDPQQHQQDSDMQYITTHPQVNFWQSCARP